MCCVMPYPCMNPDRVYLQHILDAVTQIDTYLRGISRDEFLAQRMLLDAVVRQLEFIGEAANHVSREYQAAHATIPFADMVGMRNRLIHDCPQCYKTAGQWHSRRYYPQACGPRL